MRNNHADDDNVDNNVPPSSTKLRFTVSHVVIAITGIFSIAIPLYLVLKSYGSVGQLSYSASTVVRQQPQPDHHNKMPLIFLPPSYKFWNHTSQTLDLPPGHQIELKHKDSGPLSLQLLDGIMNDMLTVPEHQLMLQTDDCFRPDTTATQRLLETYRRRRALSDKKEEESSLKPSLPILNMGFPKMGSSTLWEFFKCAGIAASHHQQGNKILELINSGAPHVLRRIAVPTKGVHWDAHMQLDVNFGECAFPQIQVLDEFHHEFPNATFVLNFRPVMDWIKSAQLHGAPGKSMAVRWRHCRLPGLLCKPVSAEQQSRHQDYCDDFGLARWWCSHVKHIRSFVKQYPSHDLIELDLYDPSESSSILAELFQTNASCWGHANENQRAKKNRMRNNSNQTTVSRNSITR